MKKIIKLLILVELVFAVLWSMNDYIFAYEGTNTINEPLKFECDYYKKEATLVYVDSSVKNLVIPEFYDGCVVTTISNSLHTGIYKNCVKAETISIPSTVTNIEENAFNGCEYLKSVSFDSNSQIESIGIGAFSDCENLLSVTLPDSLKYIDKYAFLRCYSLNSINIPNSISKIDEAAFMNCTNLKNIELNIGLQIIGESAFQDCGLEKVNIPSTVNKIDNSAFGYCSNLTIVQGDLKEIPYNIFYECKNLTSVTLSDKVKEIGSYAFNGTNISSIIIPASVLRVENGAFKNCKNLERVYFLSEPQSLDRDCFDSNSKVSLYGCYGGVVEKCAQNTGLNFVGYYKTENVKVVYKNGENRISWDEVEGVEKYNIYRKADIKGEFELIDSVETNNYSDSDIKRETSYFYVIAIDQTVDEIEIKDVKSSVVSIKTPNATINFSAKKNTNNKSVDLRWKKDDGASNYIIYRSDSKNGTYKKIGKTTKTKYTDKKVKDGKTYYYAVAVDLKEISLNKSKIKGDIKSVKIPEATISVSKDSVEVARGKRVSVRIKFNEDGYVYQKSANNSIAIGEWDEGWDGKYCTLYICGIKKGTTKFTITNDYDKTKCVIAVKVK